MRCRAQPGFDEIVSFRGLLAAERRAGRGHISNPHVLRFRWRLESELLALEQELREGAYRPQPYTQFHIRDPKPRIITVARYRDRVVHHAICAPLERALEALFIFDTYACRTGKGTLAALERACSFSRKHTYFLKLDIRHYFHSIAHDILLAQLRRLKPDRRYMDLLETVIRHPIPGQKAGRGLPIGNLTSQHFANLYLSSLDHCIKEELCIPGYVRYMDDLLLFGGGDELHRARNAIERFLREQLCLELKPRATVLAPTRHGVTFLGWRIFPGTTRLARPARIRARRAIVRSYAQLRDGCITEEEFQRSAGSRLAHIAAGGDTLSLRRTLCAVPARDKAGSNRVKRGGSWNNNAQNCRSANRNRNTPDNRNNNLGFRLASSPLRPPMRTHGCVSSPQGVEQSFVVRRCESAEEEGAPASIRIDRTRSGRRSAIG